jgi:hypothetical protein
MGYWNHRILKEKDGEEDLYRVVEVYYKRNKPYAYSKPFVCGNSLEELKQVLKWMKEAIKEPVLTENDFKQSNFDANRTRQASRRSSNGG